MSDDGYCGDTGGDTGGDSSYDAGGGCYDSGGTCDYTGGSCDDTGGGYTDTGGICEDTRVECDDARDCSDNNDRECDDFALDLNATPYEEGTACMEKTFLEGVDVRVDEPYESYYDSSYTHKNTYRSNGPYRPVYANLSTNRHTFEDKCENYTMWLCILAFSLFLCKFKYLHFCAEICTCENL